MDGNLEISVDKLPVKRLDAIEENGVERFHPDVNYDEQRLSLIRRIDFAWAVEKDAKKQKTAKDKSTPWPWQSMLENLQLAREELSVIMDLIDTVEANDAVTVAGMTRPKQLPNESLSDLAVSTATKLQCFRHLGKYFKQSAKALEQQVAREARFYGALIRLQQNWKVKRQRFVGAALGSEGFSIDLFDNILYDSTAVFRPSPTSAVRVDHDSAGMLTVHVPPNSCHSIHFGFLASESGYSPSQLSDLKNISFANTSAETPSDEECIRSTHSVLRGAHKSIFDEQVFDVINREAFNPSLGINVTGIRENYLQLSIGQGASMFISLEPPKQDDQTINNIQKIETQVVPMDTFYGMKMEDKTHDTHKKKLRFPHWVSCEIYLQQIFHEHVLLRSKDGSIHVGQPAKDGLGLLGHFCRSLGHRIFSNKVLAELENLVCRVPYLQLMSHPTWHSRTSSWSISIRVPQSILNASYQSEIPSKYIVNSQYRTRVVVTDECINVEGEGAPNVVGLFKGAPNEDMCSMNRYDCDLADLPVILLQQVASQVIRWLHEEALMVGIKANRDFLCLSFELDQGETLGVVAHIDPEDTQGCISWWLVMDSGFTEEHKLHPDISDTGSGTRKFLGHLSLDVLYSMLMDLVSLCDGSGSH